MSVAALLLVSSVTLHRFSPRSMLNAYAIAPNSLEYGFYSALAPSVMAKVFSLGFRYRGGYFSIATPNPTILFRAELLTAIRMTSPASVYVSGDSWLSLCIRSSYGANINGLMVSSVSISIPFSVSAT